MLILFSIIAGALSAELSTVAHIDLIAAHSGSQKVRRP